MRLVHRVLAVWQHEHSPGMRAIFWSSGLRKLAFSMVGFYIPVFVFLLMQEQFGVGLQTGLLGMVGFYGLYFGASLLLVLPVAWLVSRWGVSRVLFVSGVLLVSYLLGLNFAENSFGWVWMSAVLGGAANAFYWLPYETLFVKDGNAAYLGEEMGLKSLVERMGIIVGPVLGGVIVSLLGFGVLFGLGLVLAFLSGIPFVFLKPMEHLETFSVQRVWEWLCNRKHLNEVVGMAGRFTDDMVMMVFWPVLGYLSLQAFTSLGLLETVTVMFGSVSVFLAGEFEDWWHSRWPLLLATFVMGVVYGLLGAGVSVGVLVGAMVVKRLVEPFYWVTFDALVMERAAQGSASPLVFMTARGLVVNITRLLVLGLSSVLVVYGVGMTGVWWLALFGVLVTNVLWERRGEG